jgi:hypothetical protein
MSAFAKKKCSRTGSTDEPPFHHERTVFLSPNGFILRRLMARTPALVALPW